MSSERQRSLTEEVDDLTITILKLATQKTLENSRESPQRGAPPSVDVSNVTGGSPARTPRRQPSPPLDGGSLATGLASWSPPRNAPGRLQDQQIAAILLPPGGGTSSNTSRRQAHHHHSSLETAAIPPPPPPLSSFARRFDGSAASAVASLAGRSPLGRVDAEPSGFGLSEENAIRTSPASQTAGGRARLSSGLYEATMEQVAHNMSRLVRSAAMLEARSRMVAESRLGRQASDTLLSNEEEKVDGDVRGSSARSASSGGGAVASPLSRTQQPQPSELPSSPGGRHTTLSLRTADASGSTDDATPLRYPRRQAGDDDDRVPLEAKVAQGHEQTKQLVHEIHMLEVRMMRELNAKDRAHERDREEWQSERASYEANIRDLESVVVQLKDEKQRMFAVLESLGDKTIDSDERLRHAESRLRDLERAHDAEISTWKRQCESLRSQLARMRDKRDEAERRLLHQGSDFSKYAERLTHADAKVHVLQSHIHKLHVRDQLKDEQLHDVAMFVKNSLAPFVDELKREGMPECSRCVSHHYQHDQQQQQQHHHHHHHNGHRF